MLVIDGKINPRFDGNGPSRNIRNGTGVTTGGSVSIAISEEPVSFGVFARLFRDRLKCPNALYFDGSVSQVRIAGQFRPAFGARPGRCWASIAPAVAAHAGCAVFQQLVVDAVEKRFEARIDDVGRYADRRPAIATFGIVAFDKHA
jgi:hypothetical protein